MCGISTISEGCNNGRYEGRAMDTAKLNMK